MAGSVIKFFYLFFFAFVPVLYWFWFILKEDKHPEPKIWTILAFILGGIAVISSYFAESWLNSLIAPGETNAWGYFLGSAFIEEFFKFIFVALLIFKSRVFDEPVDAMIYMGFAALGFAFFENFLGFVGTNEFTFGDVFVVAFLRALGANFLHLLASVLIGFGFIYSKITRRVFPFVFSFATAVILHFIYNLFIMNQEIFFVIFPILWAVYFIILKEFEFIKLKNIKNGGILSRTAT